MLWAAISARCEMANGRGLCEIDCTSAHLGVMLKYIDQERNIHGCLHTARPWTITAHGAYALNHQWPTKAYLVLHTHVRMNAISNSIVSRMAARRIISLAPRD